MKIRVIRSCCKKMVIASFVWALIRVMVVNNRVLIHSSEKRNGNCVWIILRLRQLRRTQTWLVNNVVLLIIRCWFHVGKVKGQFIAWMIKHETQYALTRQSWSAYFLNISHCRRLYFLHLSFMTLIIFWHKSDSCQTCLLHIYWKLCMSCLST